MKIIRKIFFIINRGIIFMFKYFFHNPKFVFFYGLNYFRDNYKVEPNFYKKEEFILIIKNRKSIIRMGDGEIQLLLGRSIDYEKYNKNLAKGLKKIIENYDNNSNYILAIPERYLSKTNLELKKMNNEKVNFFRCWFPFKVYFDLYFKKNLKYADAHMFYIKNFFEENFSNYLKSKKLIIITTLKNINNQKKNLEKNFNILKWIEAKSPNPFEWYDKYIKEVNEEIIKYNKQDIVLLISAGPTSKLLVYYFSSCGVQALDIGHGIEYFYKKENNLENLLK